MIEFSGIFSLLIIMLLAWLTIYRLAFVVAFSVLGVSTFNVNVTLPFLSTTLAVWLGYFVVLGTFNIALRTLVLERSFVAVLKPINHPIIYFLFAIFIYATIDKILSPSPLNLTYSAYYKPWLLGVFFPAIAILSIVRKYEDIGRIIDSIFLVGMLNLTYAIIVGAKTPALGTRFGIGEGLTSYSAMAVSATYSLTAVIAYWHFISNRLSIGFRLLHLWAILFSTSAVIMSATRSTIAAEVLAIVYLTLTLRSTSPRRYQALTSLAALTLIVILLTVILAASNSTTLIAGRLSEQALASDTRWAIWTRALTDFSEHFLIGIGPFNFGEYSYREAWYALTRIAVTYKGNAENVILTTAAETGFIGLTFYLFVLYHSWHCLRRFGNADFRAIISALFIFEVARSQFYGHLISWGILVTLLSLSSSIRNIERNANS